MYSGSASLSLVQTRAEMKDVKPRSLSLAGDRQDHPCARRAPTGGVESWIRNKDHFSTDGLILERR